MSAAHQLKKFRQERRKMQQAEIQNNWMTGSRKRTVDGVVYGTRKEARMARNAKRETASLIKKLQRMESNNGREEEDRTAA